MSESDFQELQIRRFLLGQLGDYEHRRIEERAMVNADYLEHVRIVEEGLIEDYVDGVLAPEDRRSFETYFVATDQQRRKVTIARIISTYSSKSERSQRSAQPPRRRRRSISFSVRRHPVIFASLAAVFVIVISVLILTGVQLRRESNERARAAQRRSEIEHELAELSRGTIQAPSLRVPLMPLTFRDANETATLRVPFPAEVVELQLILTGDIHPRYTAEISRIGTAERYSLAGLVAQSTENGRGVVIRIPARLLTHGDYKISLNGTTTDGKITDAGQYQFQVSS